MENSIQLFFYRIGIKKIATYLVITLLSLLFFIPFVWLLATSFKSFAEAFSIPPTLLPRKFHPENYLEVFKRIPFSRYALNTMIISIANVTGILFSAPMAAYAVSKISWGGAKILFPLMIACMLIPFQVTMVPLYITFKRLGWVGTYLPLIVPAFLGGGIGGGYYIFLLRQSFLGIPNSLIESAKVEGAGEWRIFSMIILPLSRAALITVGIFMFLNTWSDFMGPLIYLTKSSLYTLSIGLQAFFTSHHVEWHLLMAASVLFSLPTLILFFFAQKHFIEGAKTSGLKF
jgi:multiple sugar transport system permease protein